MIAPANLCLTMIVRFGTANLERCLNSVAAHTSCWMIGDAGSTESTAAFIRSFFAKRGQPGELITLPSDDHDRAWATLRELACTSRMAFDYLLVTDADTELIVEDPDFRTRLQAACYDIAPETGFGCSSVHLLRRDAQHRDLPGDGPLLRGVRSNDHASEADRVRKRTHDIRLLLHSLEQDPNHHRHWFCLAQLLQDAGFLTEAAKTYAKRAAMGDGDEGAWYARVQEARCLRALNDDSGFVRAALAAFNQRPLRAEPLYDLARFYRERGMTNLSVLYAEAGLALERPDSEAMFVEDFVYTVGLREEYSIAAYYFPDSMRKEPGHVAADWLTLSRTAPQATRDLARSNVGFYCEPARVLILSAATRGRVSVRPRLAPGRRTSADLLWC